MVALIVNDVDPFLRYPSAYFRTVVLDVGPQDHRVTFQVVTEGLTIRYLTFPKRCKSHHSLAHFMRLA